MTETTKMRKMTSLLKEFSTIALLPLIALFILFDLVIHNPSHPETSGNLALLEVAAGHFSRLEYVSGGTLPSSILAEFAYLARNYVRSHGRHPQGDNASSSNLISQDEWLADNSASAAPGANQILGSLAMSMDLQPTLPLMLPAFDDTPPHDADSTTGFNVMELFGSMIQPDYDIYFGPC